MPVVADIMVTEAIRERHGSGSCSTKDGDDSVSGSGSGKTEDGDDGVSGVCQ